MSSGDNVILPAGLEGFGSPSTSNTAINPSSNTPATGLSSFSRQGPSPMSRASVARRSHSSPFNTTSLNQSSGMAAASMMPTINAGQASGTCLFGQNSQRLDVSQTPSPPPQASSSSNRSSTMRPSGIPLGSFGTLGVSSSLAAVIPGRPHGAACNSGRTSRDRPIPTGSMGVSRGTTASTPSTIGYTSSQPLLSSASVHHIRSAYQGSGNMKQVSEPELTEWSFFGVDIVIKNIASLVDDNIFQSAADPSEGPSKVADYAQQSQSGITEMFTTSFGGDRWKLEILRNPGARHPLGLNDTVWSSPSSPNLPNRQGANDGVENADEPLSLYLSCNILDTAHYSPDVIPTTLMFGVREAGEQFGRRGARGGWVWRVWEDEWCFGTGTEYWECHSFPSFSQLLRNRRIKELDSFVLSIQIQSPIRGTMPLMKDSHYIPADLLTGVESLLDDPSTGDVIIYVHEKRSVTVEQGSEGTSSSSEEPVRTTNLSQVPNYRKRALYAHGGLLKARSMYFQDMLTQGWAENTGDRERSVIKIEDFDFITVFWLLHYLYTDEITFLPVEDVRLLSPNDLVEGWLSSPDSLSWEWFSVKDEPSILLRERWERGLDLQKEEETSTAASNLGAIVENDSHLNGYCCGMADGMCEGKTGCRVHETGKGGTRGPKVVTGSQYSSSAADASTSRPRQSGAPDPPSPSRNISSAAGRISPLGGIGGRLSTKEARYQNASVSGSIRSPRQLDIRQAGGSSRVAKSSNAGKHAATIRPIGEDADEFDNFSIQGDPHKHPTRLVQSSASALSIYRIAHRYQLHGLCTIALNHLVSTLRPSTAFPLLLSTHLWPELYQAIKKYALSNYHAILHDPEFKRCYAEVGEGLWEHGGEVLHDFTLMLTPVELS